MKPTDEKNKVATKVNVLGAKYAYSNRLFRWLKKTTNIILASTIIILLLIVLPVVLSIIIEYISAKFDYFPEFSRHKFFEEYYKLLGTFLVMLAGFFYADQLIERRIYKRFKRKSFWLMKNLEYLRFILNKFEQAVKQKSSMKIIEYRKKLNAFFPFLLQMIDYNEIETVLTEKQALLIPELINQKFLLDEENDFENQKKLIIKMKELIDELK